MFRHHNYYTFTLNYYPDLFAQYVLVWVNGIDSSYLTSQKYMYIANKIAAVKTVLKLKETNIYLTQAQETEAGLDQKRRE